MPRAVRLLSVPLALTLAACSGGGGDPTAPAESSTTGTTTTAPAGPGLTVPQAAAMMRDYDARNNPAIEAAGAPRFDEKPWARADVGPALEQDVLNTRVDRADPPKEPEKSGPLTSRVSGVVGAARHRSGEVAIVDSPFERDPSSASTASSTDPSSTATTKEPPRTVLRVMRREGGGAWKLWSSVGAPKGALPAPLPPSTDPTPTPAQVRANQTLVPQVIDSLREEQGAPFAKAEPVRDFLDELWPGGKPVRGMTRTLQCEPYAARGSNDVADALLAVRARSATVSAVTVRCRVDWQAAEGRAIFFGKGFAAVNRVSTEGNPQATVQLVVTAIVTRDDGKPPRLLGLGGGYVVPD